MVAKYCHPCCNAQCRYLLTRGPHLLWVALSVLLNPDSLPPPSTPQQDLQELNLSQLLLPASSSSSSKVATSSKGAPGAPDAIITDDAPQAVHFRLEDVIRTPAECFEGLASVG